MARRSYLSQLVLPTALALIAGAQLGPAFAQSSTGTRILVCESANDACSQPDARFDITWSFNGISGTATPAGDSTPSHLTIQKFDSDSIVVQRVDDTGATAGLTATYFGAVHGTQISGTVQWSWPGHPGYPARGSFSAVLQDQVAAEPSPAPATAPASTLPPNLLVCEKPHRLQCGMDPQWRRWNGNMVCPQHGHSQARRYPLCTGRYSDSPHRYQRCGLSCLCRQFARGPLLGNHRVEFSRPPRRFHRNVDSHRTADELRSQGRPKLG